MKLLVKSTATQEIDVSPHETMKALSKWLRAEYGLPLDSFYHGPTHTFMNPTGDTLYGNPVMAIIGYNPSVDLMNIMALVNILDKVIKNEDRRNKNGNQNGHC